MGIIVPIFHYLYTARKWYQYYPPECYRPCRWLRWLHVRTAALDFSFPQFQVLNIANLYASLLIIRYIELVYSKLTLIRGTILRVAI